MGILRSSQELPSEFEHRYLILAIFLIRTLVDGNVNELNLIDAPEPLGKCVTTVTYTDANLYHDILTGRSVKGILHH
jgi:hypothetical protein